MDLDIQTAIEQLRKGAILLHPTDTVWGLGCSAHAPLSVDRMFKIKGRSTDIKFLLLVESERALQHIVDVPALVWELMDLSEKPITFVYENPRNIDPSLIAKDNTIAIRLVKHALCKKLIQGIGAPLVSTSANRSGRPSPAVFSQVEQEIITQVDGVLNADHQLVSPYKASSILRVGMDGKIKVIRE